MTRHRVVNFSPRMLATLPPYAYGAECADTQFVDCGHWLHGTRSPEGNVVVAGDVCEVVRALAADAAGTERRPSLFTWARYGQSLVRGSQPYPDCGFTIEFVDEFPDEDETT